MNESPENNNLTPEPQPTPDTALPTEAPAAVATPEAPVPDVPDFTPPPVPPDPSSATPPPAPPTSVAPPVEQRTPGNTKMVGPMIGIFAVLAVVAIIAAAALGGLFGGSPKQVVTAAFAATVKDQEATLAAQSKEIPMLSHLMGLPVEKAAEASQDSATLTLQSVEGVPNAALFSALLANSGLRYETRYDPAASALDFNGALFFNGSDFVDMSFFLSPELMAGGVPSFSNTLLSLTPSTLAADLKGSVLYDPDTMSDEMLAAYQDAVNGYITYYQALSRLSQDPSAFLGGMENLGNQIIANATYEKGAKADGLTTYTVTIPGADVKKGVIDYYRFLYTESDFGEAMRGMMEAMLRLETIQQQQYRQQMAAFGYPAEASVETPTYEDFINELMAELDTSIPELPTTAELKIDRKKIIRVASVVATPATPATGEELMRIDGFSMDYTNGTDSDDVTIRVPMVISGEACEMRVSVADGLADGSYSMLFQMDLAYPTMGMTIEIPVRLSLDKAGNLTIDGTMNLGDQGSMSLMCNGVMSQENGVITTSMPGSRAGLSMPGVGDVALTFDLVTTSGKLEGAIAPPAATPVFSMTEEQLQALTAEYSAGLQRMFQSLGLA